MDASIQYQWVNAQHADTIAQLAVCLTEEIMERTGMQHFDVDVVQAEKLCRDFLSQDKYHVIAAFQNHQVIGFGALCESYALYAEGAFGILQEFYVQPQYRSQAVGQGLVDQIKNSPKQNHGHVLNFVHPLYLSLNEQWIFIWKMALKGQAVIK